MVKKSEKAYCGCQKFIVKVRWLFYRVTHLCLHFTTLYHNFHLSDIMLIYKFKRVIATEKSYQHILQNLSFCVPRKKVSHTGLEWNDQNLHFWVNYSFKDVNGVKYWFCDSFVNVCHQGSSEAQNEIIARSPRDHYGSPHVSLLYFSVSQEMCSLSVKCVTLTHSLYEFIHSLVLILLALK